MGKWKTATFLAALRNDRIDAPCLFDGKRFRAYVERFFVPTLMPGDLVILDHLCSHEGKAMRKAIRDVGARPPCVPAEILPRPQPH